MLTRLRSKLTYPHIASTIALFLALTGGAFALQGKNTVDSGDIEKNGVKSSDIKNPNGVKTQDVADDGLTGDDVDESTLGQVGSAANADNATNAQNAQNATNATNAINAENATNATNAENADEATTANNANLVNGTAVQGIRYRSNATTTVTTIFQGGGLTLRAGCNGGLLSLTADSGADNASILSHGIDVDIQNVVIDDDFDSGEAVKDLVPNDDADEVLTTQFSRPASGGPIISATSSSAHTALLQVDDSPTNFECLVTGHVLRTGGTGIFAEVGPIGP